MNVLRITALFSLLSVAACAASTESDTSDTSSASTAVTPSISASGSCSSVKGFVSSHGAALVYTSATTYERVVSSGQYCEVGETTTPFYVRTGNSESCFAGYTCTTPNGG